MTKILVTGANGFVGKHLMRELIGNGAEIVAIGGTQVAPAEEFKDQEYLTLDLTKRAETDKIDFSQIAGVVHLAGMAEVGPSFEKPMDYISVNIGIEINLFESALAQGATPKFIVVSSGALYDSSAQLPLTEESRTLANSPYAVSKIGQEEMARYYTSRGFECIIVRPFNHIGPGQRPGFIVPDLAQQIVGIEKHQNDKVLVGNLDAKRDYTDVRDIVRAYRLLLDKGRSGETYNICSGKALSGHEILSGLTEAAGFEPTIESDPSRMRPSDTPEIYGSNHKLAEHTGWQPQIDVSTTLADVIADWRSQA